VRQGVTAQHPGREARALSCGHLLGSVDAGVARQILIRLLAGRLVFLHLWVGDERRNLRVRNAGEQVFRRALVELSERFHGGGVQLIPHLVGGNQPEARQDWP
jgi:hypothetical protein